MNRSTEFESEAYAADRDRLRLTASAAEDDSMERNYGIDVGVFGSENPLLAMVQPFPQIVFYNHRPQSILTSSKLSRRRTAKSA